MDYKENKFANLFEKQKANQFVVGNTTYKERIKKLKRLKNALEYTYRDLLKNALYKDFKKPFVETDLTEIYLVIKEIKVVISNLKNWTSKQKVETPLALFGTSSWIHYEPKGVCLILSPWNYPINLTFSPLVSAIAAGNTVFIKPSELTPNTSKVMADLVKDVFNENEVVLIEGAVDVAQELLKLPFNHIFFTGSPAVGKIVMEAASKNLTSVTLELGGKSPTIIDETANINNAIENLVWGKHINNGQTCIAPDYVWIHESVKGSFIEAYKKKLEVYYTSDVSTSDSYCRIVNNKHYNRLVSYIENAKETDATIELGGHYNSNDNYIEPTVISNLKDDTLLMQEEIFGPILPIKTYKNIDEVINYINEREKPLALYIYSKNKRVINYVLNNTRAGGTCINTNALQVTNHYLPFGGSNNSGIGKTHGFFGFQDFSNQRAVLKRHTIGPLNLLFPPYNNWKQKIVDLTIKWF
ncbi:aldehyde dehydrogenase family protein [Xanthomarina spongicola]|uniref:Aldehyde dehydrogenase n=1 Tax=Xanthomarina spongicola TaxID=570520 RepID=A0A316DRF9_9FLAO|nr:aldehyde dehydrogenase family protein [Xanthomarina spongicola]PWK20867.1 aldehyde dehydrogenase (NAD+) [Xanthomarina spongicola]